MKAKKVVSSVALAIGLLAPNAVFAFSDSFTYDFTHQVAISGSQTTASGHTTVYVHTNTAYYSGSQVVGKKIEIKVFEDNLFSAPYVGSIYNGAYSNETGSLSVKANQKYSAELWKDMDGQRLQGTGDWHD